MEESDQLLVDPPKTFQHLHKVKEALSTFIEEKQSLNKFNFSKAIKEGLEDDLTENILKQVIEAHDSTEENEDIKNKTNEVLTKLNQAHSFVTDLKQVGIGKDHEDIEQHLEFDALEDIAEAIEDIKDQKETETENKVQNINQEKFEILEEEKDLIREPHEKVNEEVVEDAVDVLDPGQSMEVIGSVHALGCVKEYTVVLKCLEAFHTAAFPISMTANVSPIKKIELF